MSVLHQERPAQHSMDARGLLRDHPIFHGLSAPLIDQLSASATRRTAARGAAIFAKGDPGNGLYMLLDGIVKIGVSSPSGREAVFNLLHRGEIFGEIALLDGGTRSADAIAMADCKLLLIDRRDFVPMVRREPELALRLIEMLCARLRWTSTHFEEVMFLDFPGRLAKILLRLTERSRTSAGDRKIVITQQEISQILGMSRESTNKQLRAWARRGWVVLERGGIVVTAPDALAEIARSAFEPEM